MALLQINSCRILFDCRKRMGNLYCHTVIFASLVLFVPKSFKIDHVHTIWYLKVEREHFFFYKIFYPPPPWSYEDYPVNYSLFKWFSDPVYGILRKILTLPIIKISSPCIRHLTVNFLLGYFLNGKSFKKIILQILKIKFV